MPKEFNAAVYDKKKLALLRKRAKRVEQLYTLAVHNASRIATQTSYKGEGDFFFDNYPSAKTEIDNMLQELAQALETNIKEGNDENWKLAASKNDAMVDALTKGTGIPKKNIKEWKHPNLEALQAFNERVVAGMGLSDRVWNLTKQFKAELELAMEVGIGEGKSAADLSRDVRKFLREPNKLFRRVRDKSGALRLSKAARAYHPGRGVYRSSYKNALRMTATENNIAYRTSDHERWKQMPFVLGIDIHTSNNHPQEDICDDLEGRYPKDFKFTGWHPWCRCQATAALPSEAEFIKYGKAILNGSDQNFKFGDVQKEVPGKFKNWVTKNKTRIADATQMPYFLKDNPQYLEQAGYKIPTSQKDMFVDIKTGEDKPLTTLQKAKLRQAARTQGQIDDIKKRAAEREARHKMMRDTADAALTAGKSMPEVSTTALSKAIAEGNLDKMYELAQKVQAKIAKMEAAEQKLGDLIPDVHSWHKKHSIKDLQTCHDAVKTKLDKWDGYKLSNTELKDKLNYEIDWKNDHPKYATDDVAKAIYEKKLATVEFNIKAEGYEAQINKFYAYNTKSQTFQNLLSKAGYQLGQLTEENQATQIPIVEKKIKQLEYKQKQLEAAKAKAKAKKKGTTSSSINGINTTEQKSEMDPIIADRTARAKKIVEQTGCTIDEARVMRDAVNHFTFQWDYEIRHYQTGAKFTSHHNHSMQDIARDAEACDKYIDMAPKWNGGRTYRGIAVDDATLQKFKDAMTNGDEIDMLGTSSWSTEKGTSAGFAKSNASDGDKTILFYTDDPQYGTSITHLSYFDDGENEVLCSSKARWKIISIKRGTHNGIDFDVLVKPILPWKK